MLIIYFIAISFILIITISKILFYYKQRSKECSYYNTYMKQAIERHSSKAKLLYQNKGLKYIIVDNKLYIVDEEEFDHYHVWNDERNWSMIVDKDKIKILDKQIGYVGKYPSINIEQELFELLL